MNFPPEVARLVEMALAEDIGTGDITSQLTVPAERMAEGKFHARADLVVAGIELLHLTMGADVKLRKQTGDAAVEGEVIATVRGPARHLLERERVSLNFLQRLCGIATLAREYARQVAHTKCRVLDTRKTTPGWRWLEKMAARAGGVTNHRQGLYDGVLIKNNHIAAAGGVTAALRNASESVLPVEIEVRTFDELNEALAGGATRLLLDNLTPEEAKRWIDHVDGRASCEISGGVTLATVRAYAEAGADFVSCGAITHSATAVDLNFRIQLL